MRDASENSIWFDAKLLEEVSLAFVVIDLFAERVEYWLWRAVVFVPAVKDDFDASIVEGLDAIENIDSPTIVGRERDIERDDMKMFHLIV